MAQEGSPLAPNPPTGQTVSIYVSENRTQIDFQLPMTWSLNIVSDLAIGLSAQIGAVVLISLDVNQGRYRVHTQLDNYGYLIGRVDPPNLTTNNANLPVATTTAHTAPDPITPPPSQWQRNSKPANCWILYRAAKSAQLRESNPTISAAEVSQLASAMWQSEPAHVRSQWEQRAATVRAEHISRCGEYRVAHEARAARQQRRQRKADNKANKKTSPKNPAGSSTAAETTTPAEAMTNVEEQVVTLLTAAAADENVEENNFDRQFLMNFNDDQALMNGIDEQALMNGIDEQTLMNGIDEQALMNGIGEQALMNDIVDQSITKEIIKFFYRETCFGV